MNNIRNSVIILIITILAACGGSGESDLNGKSQSLSNKTASTFSTSTPILNSSSPESPAPSASRSVLHETLAGTNPATTNAVGDVNMPPVMRSGLPMGSFSPAVQPGWITDTEFWRAYTTVFTGGSGGYQYWPAQPTPIPVTPSNVGGLTAYRIPPIPVFRPIPYTPTWHGPALTGNWQEFLQTSMACAPVCSMVIADILATTPTASIPSLGLANPPVARGQTLSLGNTTLDTIIYNPRHPAFQAWYNNFDLQTLAKALDRKAERLLAAWAALEKLLQYAAGSTGRTEFQYALVADRDGLYPDVRYGQVEMKRLEVWKYGTSFDPDSRYPKGYMEGLGLSMVIQFEGTREATLAAEKAKLIIYYQAKNELPPGNKIFK